MIELKLILTLFALKAFLFFSVIRLINCFEQDESIGIGRTEGILMSLFILVSEMLLFRIHRLTVDYFYHGMVIFYMLTTGFIDHKTRNVYRIGSIFFILSNILVFAFLYRMGIVERAGVLILVLIFSIFSILQGVFKMAGWGDVLTYIGLFFWFGTWKSTQCGTFMMLAEIILVFILIANVLFLLMNVCRLKKWKIQGGGAYLPAMAAGCVLMEFVAYIL